MKGLTEVHEEICDVTGIIAVLDTREAGVCK
jgi:hypothetical protein